MRRSSTGTAPLEGVAGALAYGEWPGPGPAVVLIPGIFASHRAQRDLARRLAPTHRVIAFDLRGRGRSPRDGPFGLARHAADVWRAIDELGLQRPILCGHSLGAFVVATAAASRPRAVGGLVLLDGGLWSPTPVPVELVHAVFADDVARLGREFPDVEAYAADRDIAATPEVLDELAYELAASGGCLTPVMPATAFIEDVASIAAHTPGNRLLATLDCPIVAIRALRGIGGDPHAQMLPDATVDDARASAPAMRIVDLADATHGNVIRDPHAARVTSEILPIRA
jgi:pimeloyl-ACP methyl ester carboxylesterase